ncbi:MAG: folylpolyglutamate synthase/dihydrofolate synthase family protein [Halioglobus sp.]
MNNDSLQDWLERLEKLHPVEIDLGLARITEVAHSLDLLPLAQPVITVAGTNGKGSTVAVLEAVLTAQGLRCGTFTSPHFLRFNERIRVAQEDASDADIVLAFEAIESARGEISLTYFEFAALAALLVFRAHQPDVVILEVGLGGRLDAVNIVEPSLCVITRIDLDHQGWLGDTREQIAVEKAGILRRGVPVVVSDQDPPASLRRAIQDIGAAPALFLGEEFSVCPVESGLFGQWQVTLQTGQGKPRTLPAFEMASLLPQNVAAAVQAALAGGFDVSNEQLQIALDSLVVTGRRQHFERDGVSYVLDVAHNPAAVEALLEYLQSSCCNGRRLAVFSAMKDKDLKKMLSPAVSEFDAWMLADQPGNARSATAKEVMAVLADLDVEMISSSKNLRQAFARAQQLAAPGDTIVVFGSFTTVAAVLNKFLPKRPLSELAHSEPGHLDEGHSHTLQEAR